MSIGMGKYPERAEDIRTTGVEIAVNVLDFFDDRLRDFYGDPQINLYPEEYAELVAMAEIKLGDLLDERHAQRMREVRE